MDKKKILLTTALVVGSVFAFTLLTTRGMPALEKANDTFITGDFAAAKQQYLALAKTRPEDAEVLQKIAVLYLLENNTRQAEKYFEEAIKNTSFIERAWPLSVELYTSTAVAYFRADDFDKAAQYLGKAAGPFGFSFINELTAAKKQLELFHDSVPYIISGNEVAKIPFSQIDPLPIIQISVNGSKQLNFIIDTGGEEIYIDSGVAKELGIQSVSSSTIPKGNAAGSGAKSGLGKIDRIQIAGLEVKNVPTDIVDMGPISRKVFEGKAVHGIIGTRFLMHFLSSIDYKNRQLVLRQKNSTNRKTFEDRLEKSNHKKIPFSLFYTHLIFAKGSFNGKNEGLYFIDTGLANAGILSSEKKLKASGAIIDWSKSKTGAGIGGEAEALEITVDEVSLGIGKNKIIKQDVPGVLLKDELKIFDAELGFEVQGLISHAFFKGTVLTFDFENMNLILQE